MNEIFDKLVKSKISKFEQDYINLSRQIFVDKEGKLIHPGEFGTYREKIIGEFLAPFLPSRLAVGSGFIITSNNNISTQCDIIIYDKDHTPVIESGEQRFFPIECVVSVIEVKSKLTKSTFKKALQKLSNIKKLRNDISTNVFMFDSLRDSKDFDAKRHIFDQIGTFLICESVDIDIKKEMDNLFAGIYKGIDKSLFHNMVLVLDSGCFMYHDDKRDVLSYYPYYDYSGNIFTNVCVMPDKLGYNKEHILTFLNYFYMLVSSTSVMYVETTYYLGEKRKQTILLES